MRVLVLSHMFPDPASPTYGVFVSEQLRGLRSQGVECLVVSPTPWVPSLLKWVPRWHRYAWRPTRDTVLGFQVEYPRVPLLPRAKLFGLYGLVYFLFCCRLVKRLVRQNKIDLIHAQTIMPDGFAAVLLGRRLRLPVVCTVQGSDVNIYPFGSRLTFWATKWALKRVDSLVAVSHNLKDKIITIVGDRHVSVVHSGVDCELFTRIAKPEARARLEISSDEKMVVYVGNLVAIKGIQYLIEAFARIDTTDTLLYMVGDGDLRDRFVSLAHSLGVFDRCRFVGRRPHEELPVWLSSADCFILPSLHEGFGAVIIEAMACRVPVVATEVGGIPETVRHGETGVLVPARDPEALAKAIQAVLAGGDKISAMVDRAEKKVKDEFTSEYNARQTLALYQQVLTSSDGAAK